jgi:uncharacterized short protein YbdD (DUF466 family)
MGMGKVTTWFMTPEELAEYVAKHPIKSSESKEAKFSTEAIDYKVIKERKKEAMKGKRIIDQVDKDAIHKLFMAGTRLEDIAKSLKVSMGNLNNYILQQRKINPEKWPYRTKGK